MHNASVLQMFRLQHDFSGNLSVRNRNCGRLNTQIDYERRAMEEAAYRVQVDL